LSPTLRSKSFAILAILVVSFTGAVATAQQGPRKASTDHERLARAVYAELVNTNTMDTVGSTTKAVRLMAKRFLDAGFPAEDVQILIPPGDSTKGNLVVRYRGTGGANGPKPLLLLAHVDVVAALRSDWSRDPFELQEDNGFFYGRGSADDKAMASIWVANLLQYKKDGWKPNRDLILALTAAEEGGDNNGAEWLVQEHKSLIDAAYALNEGGGGTLVGKGMDVKPLFNSIQAAEKVPENFTLTVKNPGGHSSVPRPDNAIYSLANALSRLGKFTFPVSLNPVSRAFFEQTAKVETPAECRGDACDRGESGECRCSCNSVEGSQIRVDASDDVRSDEALRRSREQRASPDCYRKRELPHRSDVEYRRDAGDAGEGVCGYVGPHLFHDKGAREVPDLY
jgi:Acetylornithine deacetylase/Succinyl-diaminopimelate desuccinylase and related deacylases